MKKTIKRVVCVVAVLLIIMSESVAFATDKNNETIMINDLYTAFSAKHYACVSDYYNGEWINVEEDKTEISIWTNKNKVCFKLKSNTIALEKDDVFSGDIYILHGNGYYDDKLILGDYTQVDMINIAQFRIFFEKQPILMILVEKIDTGELVEFSFQIKTSTFLDFFGLAKSNTIAVESMIESVDSSVSNAALTPRIIELMETSKRITNSENPMRSQSSSVFKNTDSSTGLFVSYTELYNFCTSINSSPSTGITPSSFMQVILCQTGWKMYKDSSYCYVLHGVANSSTEQLVGITLLSLSNNHPNSTTISASYTVAGSCTVIYDKVTHTATLFLANTGIRLEDATIAVELVGGTTNFYEGTKTWNLTFNGSVVKNILYAIASALGVPSDIWAALTVSNNSSPTVDFGSDANQMNLYGGLVRAVGNQTSYGKYLWGSGNSLGIIGRHYNSSTKTYSYHRIAWGFTAYSLL